MSNAFTCLKLELLCTEAEVIPLLLLLPVYLETGVFDINAELPSGSSPSWEECNAVPQVVNKYAKGQQ